MIDLILIVPLLFLLVVVFLLKLIVILFVGILAVAVSFILLLLPLVIAYIMIKYWRVTLGIILFLWLLGMLFSAVISQQSGKDELIHASVLSIGLDKAASTR